MFIKIMFNSPQDAVLFVKEVGGAFKSDIDISYGRYVIDGKSLLGILSLGIENPMFARLDSQDEEEVRRFVAAIEKYRFTNSSEK